MLLADQATAYEAMIYTANITMEFISWLLCLFLVVAVFVQRRHTHAEGSFAVVCTCMLLNLTGDFISWFFTRGSDAMSTLMCLIGNNLTYWFGPLAYTGVMLFAFNAVARGPMLARVGGRRPVRRVGRALLVLILLLLAVELGLVVVSYATGCLYRIEAGNHFVWGPLRSAPDVITLIQYLLTLALMLVEAEQIGSALHLWLFCAGLSVVGLLCELALPTLMCLYPMTTLSLVLIRMQMSYRSQMALMQKDLELSESKTKLLSGQIRSHFIFNSLAAIEELCIEDPQLARKGIEDFSRYLRGNMQAVGDGGLIPFMREVENVKSYLALETIDPNSTFRVEWDLEETSFRLPSLVIQPLVENSVRHGVARKGADGLIRIKSWESSDAYCVSVEDNGGEDASPASRTGFRRVKGRDSAVFSNPDGVKSHNGIALDNTRARLALLCEGTLDLSLTESGALATVRIPKGVAV